MLCLIPPPGLGATRPQRHFGQSKAPNIELEIPHPNDRVVEVFQVDGAFGRKMDRRVLYHPS